MRDHEPLSSSNNSPALLSDAVRSRFYPEETEGVRARASDPFGLWIREATVFRQPKPISRWTLLRIALCLAAAVVGLTGMAAGGGQGARVVSARSDLTIFSTLTGGQAAVHAVTTP